MRNGFNRSFPNPGTKVSHCSLLQEVYMEIHNLKTDSEPETQLGALVLSNHPHCLKLPFEERTSGIWPLVPDDLGLSSDFATYQLCHPG